MQKKLNIIAIAAFGVVMSLLHLLNSQSLGLLQPHLERVAIAALQVCCLLLPPPSRRKLQLLMRMISRMSENVDMPRLHDAVGTRSLVKLLSFHKFFSCYNVTYK